MQTFNQHLRQFQLKDKYWGRSLNSDEFTDALHNFVGCFASHRNNYKTHQKKQAKKQKMLPVNITTPVKSSSKAATPSVATTATTTTTTTTSKKSSRKQQTLIDSKQVLIEIVSQLGELIKAVEKTKWRFYGCSVLIVFDSTPRYYSLSHNNNNSNIIRTASPISVSSEKSFSQANTPRSSSSSIAPFSSSIGEKHHKSNPYRVSVRLIDFTHSHRDESKYDSYDPGLMFGLNNLKKMYFNLLQQLGDKGV